MPSECNCLRAALPRLELLYDLPLLLSSAAALESERKCSVITCCRWHNIAASAAKPPRQTIASLYKSKVGGNCVRLTNRRQSDSEDRRKSNRIATKIAGTRFGKRRSSSSCSLAMSKPFSWGIKRGPFSFVKENGPLVRVPCAARGTRSSALRCRNAILHTFHRAVNNNSASFIWKESISIWKSEKNSGARCRL